jgi:NTP pyrophosphatase (non-canonical NTP hydrolase)
MKTFEELQEAVLEWADERDLLEANPARQLLKVVEELGELASSIAKNKPLDRIDAMGDVLVTLIILSAQLGIKPVSCLEVAYNEIADRKGETVNGIFIKES